MLAPRFSNLFKSTNMTRKRDATQRENLSQTIRALRADSSCQSTDFERMHTKYTDAQRKLGLAEATERSLKQQIRAAEQAARASKEEMARMRALVNQTRRQCANDVRKRERVIEGLKKHVSEGRRPRGSGKAVGVVSVNVVAGVGGDGERSGDAVAVNDIDYDLRMETNGFLTDLARDLSEENENIGALLRRTVLTLRTLSGCEKGDVQKGDIVAEMETGYKSLDTEMGFIIEHLRNLLTNPSFVPLEELEIREEENIRLRQGFEKMESRWQEAVRMMDGWQKRMSRSGQAVNLEELQMGLRLSPLRPKEGETGHGFQLSTLLEEGESEAQTDNDAPGDSGLPYHSEPEIEYEDFEVSDSSLSEDEIIHEVPGEHLAKPRQDIITDADSSPPPGSPPQLSPLRPTTKGNCGLGLSQQASLDTAFKEETSGSAQLAAVSLKTSTFQTESENKSSPFPSDETSPPKGLNTHHQSPRKISNPVLIPCSTPKLQQTALSKLPRPRDNLPPQQSPLTMATIAAKLAATEREADAARVRAKIRAAKMKRETSSTLQAGSLTQEPRNPQPNDSNSEHPLQDASAVTVKGTRKRKASGRSQGGRASRRRSTLSPWELESLILGGARDGIAASGDDG